MEVRAGGRGDGRWADGEPAGAAEGRRMRSGRERHGEGLP